MLLILETLFKHIDNTRAKELCWRVMGMWERVEIGVGLAWGRLLLVNLLLICMSNNGSNVVL